MTDDAFPTAVVTIEHTLTLAWTRLALQDFFRRFPVVPQNALRMLAHRLREQAERYHDLAVERVPMRIARTLFRLVQATAWRVEDGPGVVVPLSRAELGQMTGTTMFTVSRVLSEWETEGLLYARRGRVVVTDLCALAAIAQKTRAVRSRAPRREAAPSCAIGFATPAP